MSIRVLLHFFFREQTDLFCLRFQVKTETFNFLRKKVDREFFFSRSLAIVSSGVQNLLMNMIYADR